MVHGDLPSASDLAARHRVPDSEAAMLRELVEIELMDAFIARTMPSGDILEISERSRQHIVSRLGPGSVGNYQPGNINASLIRYVTGQLEDHPNRIERQQQAREDASSLRSITDEDELATTEQQQDPRQPTDPTSAINSQSRERSPSVPETAIHNGGASEHPSHTGTDVGLTKKGQNLLGLIYAIAEEKAKREGYIHRGVTCNSCNIIPIRGIRYRCANCVDYDLCEQCEALQMHPRTHLFYKVRVPAPFLGNPRKPQPVWYPGKPGSVLYPMNKEDKTKFCQQSGFQLPEVEALWEQFRCLAATDWPDDPLHYCMAISRHTFDRCFIPKSVTRPPPPNLIYDRIFAFYDADGNGLIGFEEFLMGIACLQHKGKEDRIRRVFDGYDIDRDGFVNRKDFLRIFKALFALNKELARDIINRLQDDDYDDDEARNIIASNQAISSAFTGTIPPGETLSEGQGKFLNQFGDHVPINEPVETITDDTRRHPVLDSLELYFPEAEENHGQEIIYQVIEDAINELLDPLFRMREDLDLQIIRTSEERKRFPEEITRIIDAGFWYHMLPLLQRFERKWRTNTRMTVHDRPGEAEKLMQYLKTSEQFKKFDPSHESHDFASGPPSELKEAPTARSEYEHHTRLSTPELPGASQVQEAGIFLVPVEDQAEMIVRSGMSDAELADRDFQWHQCRSEGCWQDINIELMGDVMERRQHRDGDQRRIDNDLRLRVLRRRSLSNASSDASTAGLVFDHNEWDIVINEDPEENPGNFTPDYNGADGSSQASTHEFKLVECPTDPTLPQNRLDEAEAVSEQSILFPVNLIHIGSQASGLPSHSPPSSPFPDTPAFFPAIPTEPHQPSSPSPDIPAFFPAIPDEPAQLAAAKPKFKEKRHFVRYGSMSRLRPHTPPPLERLKELALIEMLKDQESKRGGWGRIGWEEFEEIMKGPKGQALGFLNSWSEMAIF